MKKSPYELFQKDDLILRDHLAIDRTILANEKTFLAYIHTCLGVLISGASLIKFFDITIINLLGWVLIVLGIVILIIGIYRFLYIKKDLKKIR